MTARHTAFTRPLAMWVALVLAALASVSAAAQVHRWVDERGVVQYGDRPPASGATTLRTPAAAPPPAPAFAPNLPVSAAPIKPASPPKEGAAAPARAAPAKPAITERLLAQQRADNVAALSAQSPGMHQLIANCKANRGVDCDTPQGMRNLQRESTPITSEEQSRIAGLRARRANCARTPSSLGC